MSCHTWSGLGVGFGFGFGLGFGFGFGLGLGLGFALLRAHHLELGVALVGALLRGVALGLELAHLAPRLLEARRALGERPLQLGTLLRVRGREAVRARLLRVRVKG